MNYGYDEILNDLKQEYERVSGTALWEQSETFRRFEAIASELFALSCFANRNLVQSFPQSATGEYLDAHAAIRGVTRKPANEAEGTLTFSISEPSDGDIEIPEGTVCSVKTNPFLQFKTTQAAVIEAGNLSADCPAVSLEKGSRYNVKRGAVTVMVNAPVGVSAVTNSTAFSGGKDAESDSHLRQRVLSHYGIIQNGINASSIENLVMENDFVTDCHIANAAQYGRTKMYVSTIDDALSAERIALIKNCIEVNRVFGAVIDVQLAEPKSFDISVELHLTPGYGAAEVEDEVYDAVRDFCLGARIGTPIEFNDLANILSKLDGVKRFRISSPDALGDAIYCDADEYLFLDELAVEAIE